MKTTELFDFRFVDRKREQEILNNFFENKTETTLWIKGDGGLGKTTFFNYVYNNWQKYSLCYINIKNGINSANIISEFILKLQSFCDIDFLSMVKKKYKQFYNCVYKSFKDITTELFPQINNIVSIILDTGYIAITMHDKHISTIEMINDYIRKILEKRNLCICVDNFSRCDLETANIFFQVFKTFFQEEGFRGCIITTSEELKNSLQEAIHHCLPYTEIKISNLKKFIYFCEILEPIFELKDFEEADLKYLFEKCKGSPRQLSTIISKLLEKNGIIINSLSKARIDKKILFTILQAECIRFKEDDFTAAQKWIIFSYICLAEITSVEMLEKLALYVADRSFLHRAYNQQTFQTELLHLIDNKILIYDANNTISTCHDIDYRELTDIFYNSQLKGIFTQYAYEFLKMYSEFPEKQELLCKHAREVGISGWERMNFCYGKSLAKKKQFYDAQRIFS